MPHIPALDEPNPLEGATLVIYSTHKGQVEYEPRTPVGQETGYVGIGLWARFEDEGAEIPLYTRAEEGTWLSLSVDIAENTTDVEVSQAFYNAVSQLWDGVDEDTWNQLTIPEKYIHGRLRDCVVTTNMTPEAAGVIELCKERADE
jgi:hypothetical protein